MAAKTDIAIIQVCFNLLDPYQRSLYNHASRHTNRSGYVKRLVQRDMEGAAVVTPRTAAEAASTDDFNAEAFI